MNVPWELGSWVGVGGAPERSAAATPKKTAASTTATATGERGDVRGGGRPATAYQLAGGISAFHAGPARRGPTPGAVRLLRDGSRRGAEEVHAAALMVRRDDREVVDRVPEVDSLA